MIREDSYESAMVLQPRRVDSEPPPSMDRVMRALDKLDGLIGRLEDPPPTLPVRRPL